MKTIPQAEGPSSALIWVGLALSGVGLMVEGAVTGTVQEQHYPYAALVAWVLILAGSGLMLLGYRRRLATAGLPSNPAFFLWAILGIGAWVVGWSNLRGAIRTLDASLRDILVFVGVPVGLLALVLAIVSLVSWLRRLNPEQQALHREIIRPWLFALLAVTLGAMVGAIIISYLVIGR